MRPHIRRAFRHVRDGRPASRNEASTVLVGGGVCWKPTGGCRATDGYDDDIDLDRDGDVGCGSIESNAPIVPRLSIAGSGPARLR